MAVWRKAGNSALLRGFSHYYNSSGYYEVQAEYWLPDVESFYSMSYLINGKGEVQITGKLKPTNDNYPELPRFGMTMIIPGSFSLLEWYGRGPHENYQDRNESAFIGLYSGRVKEQYYPYISPQENGYKTDVRWLTLKDESGEGYMISGDPLICFSALHYSNEDLTREKRDGYHSVDLIERQEIYLNIDYKQMGVGGDNAWNAKTHAVYSLPFKDYSFSFILHALKKDDDPFMIYKCPF